MDQWRNKYHVVHLLWSYQYTARRVFKDWWLTR